MMFGFSRKVVAVVVVVVVVVGGYVRFRVISADECGQVLYASSACRYR
jgi:hypothetical protein